MRKMGLFSSLSFVGIALSVGYLQIAKLTKEEKNLKTYFKILNDIKTDIEWTSRPVGDACVRSGQKMGEVIGSILIDFGTHIEESTIPLDISKTWEKFLEPKLASLTQNKGLADIYRNFSTIIGATDKASQLSQLQLTINEVEDSLNLLRKKNEKYIPVILKLSLTGGLLLALLMV